MKSARVPALLFCALAFSSAAFSQTWVSNAGSDSNACTMAAPCKTFQHAAGVTPVGGQLAVLNAGDYGPLTITQSIRIEGNGFAANNSTTTSDAIVVNTPAGSVVQIHNLSLHGNGSVEGIYFENAGALDVDHVQITGFEEGIVVAPSGVSDAVIKDTTVENCNYVCLFFEGTSASALTAKIINTHVRDGSYGIYAYQATVAAYNSTFSSPGTPSSSSITYGILTEAGSSVFVDNCEFNGFYFGIWSGANVLVSRSSFINNLTGVIYSVASNGNNSFFGNTTNGTFSSTIPLQ